VKAQDKNARRCHGKHTNPKIAMGPSGTTAGRMANSSCLNHPITTNKIEKGCMILSWILSMRFFFRYGNQKEKREKTTHKVQICPNAVLLVHTKNIPCTQLCP